MIDRALQRRLLEKMRDAYPREADVFADEAADLALVAENLSYLEEHGLCNAGLHWSVGGTFAHSGQKITARGIDFLTDDGGLSAILGTVTVRLHADTIRDLIAARIEATDIPAAAKATLRRHLDALSETGLRAATTDLIQTGLRHLPDALTWLQRLSGL